MKVALLINRENFEKYADWKDAEFELIHMGNAQPDPAEVIATQAQVLVVDAIMRIGEDILGHMPSLRLVHSQGVAYNGIDLSAARRAGIDVCNNAGVNAKPVAEQTILLMLALLKSFRQNEDMVYAGKQIEAKTACFVNGLPELGGCTVGIVGAGAIGHAVIEMLRSFGCKILYYTRRGDIGIPGAQFTQPEELYRLSDIVSLHVPVTPETENMIDAAALGKMKRGAILINASRGELMNHDAVVGALISGQLGGLGTDTLAPEPVKTDNPLISALPAELRYKVALSPHIAGISAGSFMRTYKHIRQNIEAAAKGRLPDCIVN